MDRDKGVITFESLVLSTISTDEYLLPILSEKLRGVGLIGELCKGFQLLMDRDMQKVVSMEKQLI
ncbi:hypothetical protein H5410_049584 [Solanum commersonii]|uniref:Uncharacterized protein n=1 Tax=Solanum commersonii TaxID=4109 RepID=A0A9J5WUL8_SOLCO|nr:hypothetical protein H5410_049584 [Solanum commersonii]